MAGSLILPGVYRALCPTFLLTPLCLTPYIVHVAFVRTKTIKGIDYHYLVEGVREAGKVRQRVVAYLGTHKSVKAAHAYWVCEARKHQDRTAKQHAQQMAKTLKQYL